LKTNIIKFYFHTIGEDINEKMIELKRYWKRYYLEYEKDREEQQLLYIFSR
jgi:hypothetical protein